jgi:uncharacterized protein (UPF0371 family)
MRLLQQLKERAEIILCIYAGDIERKKVRADFGIAYDSDALKRIDDLREWGLEVRAVVITRFEDQSAATLFKNKLERRGVSVHTHRATRGYPTDEAGLRRLGVNFTSDPNFSTKSLFIT